MKKILIALAILLAFPISALGQVNLPQGGTGLTTYTQGDIVYYDTSTIRFSKLPIGSTGECLTVVSSLPDWGDCLDGLTFGTDNQIPVVNATTDDYDYSSNFIFGAVSDTLQVNNIGNTLGTGLIIKTFGEDVPQNIDISAGSSTGGGNAGGAITILSGAGDDVGSGGTFILQGGAGGSKGIGGSVSLLGGIGGSLLGNGGAVYMTGGDAQVGTDGNGGDAWITAGVKDGTGMNGTLLFNQSDGEFQFSNPALSFYAILDTSNIATSSKTFTLPNTTGTLALTSDIPSPLTLGTTTQIPYMNAGGTDFIYSNNLLYNGTNLTIAGGRILQDPASATHNLISTLTRFSSTQSLYQNILTSTESANMDLIIRYIPKGTTGRTAYQVWGGSDTANGGLLEFSHLRTSIQFKSNKSGTGTLAPIDFIMATTTVMTINTSNQVVIGTGLIPDANDGAYLGTSSLGFSDLFLAEGAVINWDNSDLTLTQTGNTLALAGGGLDIQGSLQVDSIVNDTGLAHGAYTPTRSAEANMDANVTMTEAQYMRVGNTVTVSGRFTADPTLTATTTSFEITLPVASNIGAVEDLSGVAFCGAIAGMGAEVIGVVTNDTAKIQWVSTDITNQSWSYTFSYQVI